jgi:uncharacterized membrane protein YfcA
MTEFTRLIRGLLIVFSNGRHRGFLLGSPVGGLCHILLYVHGRRIRGFSPAPFSDVFLGYTNPSVSATNQLYNIVAIPSGVYRYCKEGRMVWPLTWVVVAGTLPGVFIGAFVRIAYLPDPKAFKLFAGGVLLWIGGKMVLDLIEEKREGGKKRPKNGFRNWCVIMKRPLLRMNQSNNPCFRRPGDPFQPVGAWAIRFTGSSSMFPSGGFSS